MQINPDACIRVHIHIQDSRTAQKTHIEIKSLWKNTEMPRNELPVQFCSYMLVPSQAGPGYQIDHREKRNKNLYGALKQH